MNQVHNDMNQIQNNMHRAMNKRMTRLNGIAQAKNLEIATLTTLHGNCIFESLKYFELFDNIETVRIGLSVLMIIMKNKKNFFPDREDSLNDMFSFNDIEYVYCNEHKKLYKYTYEAMCIDLAMDSSWTRLNTQLLFMIISFLYNVKIVILNDRHIDYTTEISMTRTNDAKTIHLGQIGECHYVPLKVIDIVSESDDDTDSLNNEMFSGNFFNNNFTRNDSDNSLV